MLLEIGSSRTSAGGEPRAWNEARAHFAQHHWVKLPGFLSPPVLARVQRGVARGIFVETHHERVFPPSVDLHMRPDATSGLLELLSNDPRLREAVEDLTGCRPLASFEGFIYRLTPDLGLHHNWHNDLMQGRRIAMSVNLEAAPYAGGLLQIREVESGDILDEVANVAAGDALLFRIDAALQHRVTPVTDGVKTAFAGWFRATGSLRDRLRGAARQGSGAR